MSAITVRTNDVIGKIKPMHCVNNAPMYKFAEDQRITNLYSWQEAGIPYGRTHDASIHYGYGGDHVIDVSGIFPDFNKDENDPDSYDFQLTDEYLKIMILGGTKPFYRLGSKIEHWSKKYNTLPPKDFTKWAKICEHIIRHYNEGWANGYEMEIEYWEIWNEADLHTDDSKHKSTWGGTAAQFYDLYNVVSKHLKECFPHLKIGGPAIANCNNTEWINNFFDNIETNPDFFSWHIYAYDVNWVVENIRRVREILDRRGLKNTESILNEWNYVRGWIGEDWVYSLRQMKKLKGASFIASVMCASQYEPLDMLMYYDARPSGMNGMFNTDIVSDCLKGYYPFKMFNELYKLGNCVKTESDFENIKTCCAVSDDKSEVMIMSSYFDDNDNSPNVNATISVGDYKKAEIYLLDEEHDMDLIRTLDKPGTDIEVEFKLYSTYLIKIER